MTAPEPEAAATPAGTAMTVLGPVSARTLGIALIHEHLRMDATPLLALHGGSAAPAAPFDLAAAAEARWDPASHPDNYRFSRDDLVADELRGLAALGVGCVVDCTPPALGRSPRALEGIARATGIHVVMGTGFYLAPTHPRGLAGASVAAIADALIGEIRDGDRVTGIRPGIIGEIGTGDPPDPAELKVLEACAIAAWSTGLAVSVHLHPWGRTGMTVVDRLGAIAPERVILGHCSTAWDDLPYLRRLLDTGVTLGFDLFGFDHSLLGVGRWPPADRDVAGTVAQLVADGFADRIVLSQDIGVRTRLTAYGGWGYGHLIRHVVPLLRAAGCSVDDLERMLVRNPARLLAIGGEP